jgi:hypothetical protein
VAEIEGSRGSEESPGVGCSKSRVAKSRGGSPLDPGTGGPLDQEPHRAYRAFGGSEVERTSSRHQKSRSAESRGTSEEHVAEPQGGARVIDRWTRVEKILLCRSGCVTNWYQSMVTTLGLLGLMNELRRSSVRNTLKKSNPLS